MKIMKTRKILLFVLALTLISSLLVIIPSADGGKIVISEDYNSLTYNGKDYVLFPEMIKGNINETFFSDSDFALTDEQQAEISFITAYACEDVYIRISISFEKGGYLDYSYINADYIDDYERFLSNGGAEYTFFDYKNYEDVYIKGTDIFQNPIKVKSYEIYYYEVFSPVNTTSADGYFSAYSGDILFDNDGNYYYYDFNADNGEYAILYQIDSSIFQEGDIIDVPFDDGGFIVVISAVLLSLFFGAIPLAALIVCLILSFKANHPYRRGLRIAAILCAIEIVAFIATMILLLI